MFRVLRFRFIYRALVVCILGSYIWYVYSMRSASPPDAVYSFASGHLGDFYAYLYMIHRGQTGHLLYKSVYSSVGSLPELLIHPFFHVIGFISQPFHFSSGFIFISSRLAAWILLFFSIGEWINSTIRKESTKLLAGVLYLSSTGVWSIQSYLRNHEILLPVIWNDYFDTYSKYLRIPPHHILSFVCLIWILLYITKRSTGRREQATGIVLSVCLGLLQPYISFLLLVILFTYTVLFRIVEKRAPPAERYILFIGMSSALCIGMNYFFLQFVLRLPFASTSVVSIGPRSVSTGVYLAALGPCVWASLLAFTSTVYMKKTSMKLLVLWAWIPFVFFLLPEIGNITNTNRLLQTYQQIPLSILAAIGIESILQRIPFRRVVLGSVIVFSLLYGFIPYVHSMKRDTNVIQSEYFNVYIPEYLGNVFSYLDTSTPADSMILSGTILSSMLPAYAHNRVLTGHDSSTPDFEKKLKRAIDFYQGKLSTADIHQFLKDYHIAYILYGVDAPSWNESVDSLNGILKPVFQSGPVTVIEVKKNL